MADTLILPVVRITRLPEWLLMNAVTAASATAMLSLGKLTNQWVAMRERFNFGGSSWPSSVLAPPVSLEPERGLRRKIG